MTSSLPSGGNVKDFGRLAPARLARDLLAGHHNIRNSVVMEIPYNTGAPI